MMRKVILFIATSLEGFIAGPAGEIDWLFTDQDYGYTEFFAGVDTVLMGCKTYEVSLSFGEYPYPGTQSRHARIRVVSHTERSRRPRDVSLQRHRPIRLSAQTRARKAHLAGRRR
jgi:dihydrofolate reductase